MVLNLLEVIECEQLGISTGLGHAAYHQIKEPQVAYQQMIQTLSSVRNTFICFILYMYYIISALGFNFSV